MSWTQVVLKFFAYPYWFIYGIFFFLPTATCLPFKWRGDEDHVFTWLAVVAGVIVALLAFLEHILFEEVEVYGFTIMTMACIAVPWCFFMDTFLRLKKD
ncbi:MAG: hypothetical protein WC517_04785 [Patescibacteria group bacterium]